MSLFHIFVLVTLCLVFLLAIIMTYYYKDRFRNMSEMLLSMAIGTNIGLTTGVLFGSLYQGNLFYSTLISILVGILAGTTCGIISGILPSLEGYMAGLMGGMMGAMLGEMITKEQSVIIINLFLTLTVSTLFLFPILTVSSKKETKIANKKWLFKPFSAFIFFAVYLFLGSQIDKQVIFSISSSPIQKDYVNHHSHISQNETQHHEITISVHPSQYSYDPSKVMLEKDRPVSLILENNDSIEHDIEIRSIPIKDMSTETHVDHIKRKADFHVHASAQKQTKVTFTPLQEGTYEFYCTIPGHKERGMTGFLIVT